MSTQGTVRRILVVGGTGMLATLCRALPPRQLIVAARFVSNAAEVAALSPQGPRIPLNYRSERSAGEFLKTACRLGPSRLLRPLGSFPRARIFPHTD
ncbi:MAG: hypothetical protein V6Z86_09920 [Hyphomicrobiales bacterium]